MRSPRRTWGWRWLFTTKTGDYGANYIQRALVTAIGLGANRPEDAVYPTSEGPSILGSYTGEKKYVMHFPKGQLPSADGFWSLSMYDKEYFFVANPLNRYSISARQNLKPNADGLVDLYIQAVEILGNLHDALDIVGYAGHDLDPRLAQLSAFYEKFTAPMAGAMSARPKSRRNQQAQPAHQPTP